MKPVLVYFMNLQRYASEEFPSLEAAIEFAKSKGFDCAFHRGTTLLGAWSIIGGFKAL